MDKEAKGTILAFAAALISGVAIPVNKFFVVDMNPAVFTATRALIIGLIFLAISWRSKKLTKHILKGQKWFYLVLIGLIGGGLAFLLYFQGLQITTSSRGAFLHKTLPIYTTILAFMFLKEKIPQKQLVALGMMFLGIVAIYFDKITPTNLWSNPSLGDVLVILATVLWAIENIIAKKSMINGESNFVVSAARMLIGSLFLFGVLVLVGNLNAIFSLSLVQIVNLFISTGILFGYVFCWYSSIKLINVSKAAAILLLSPVISMILGIIMFNEPTPIFQLIGSGLVLVGAYLVSKVKSEFAEGV